MSDIVHGWSQKNFLRRGDIGDEFWSQVLLSPIFLALQNGGFQLYQCLMAIEKNYREKVTSHFAFETVWYSIFWSIQGIASHYLFEVGSRKDDYFCFRGEELCNKNQKLSQAMCWNFWKRWRTKRLRATKQTLKLTGQRLCYWTPSKLHVWQPWAPCWSWSAQRGHAGKGSGLHSRRLDPPSETH